MNAAEHTNWLLEWDYVDGNGIDDFLKFIVVIFLFLDVAQIPVSVADPRLWISGRGEPVIQTP